MLDINMEEPFLPCWSSIRAENHMHEGWLEGIPVLFMSSTIWQQTPNKYSCQKWLSISHMQPLKQYQIRSTLEGIQGAARPPSWMASKSTKYHPMGHPRSASECPYIRCSKTSREEPFFSSKWLARVIYFGRHPRGSKASFLDGFQRDQLHLI